MELSAILNTTAVRVVVGSDQPRVFVPSIAKVLTERYQFVRYPTTIEEFSSGSLEFEYGTFFNDAVVSKLSIHGGGVMAEAQVTSDDLDIYLDDVLNVLGEFGISTTGAKVSRLYVSALEVRMEGDFDGWLATINPVTRAVRASLEASGVQVDEYQVGGFHLMGEGSEALKPQRFVFERRAEQPFGANVYFSSAPMTTSKHIELLEDLDRLLLKG